MICTSRACSRIESSRRRATARVVVEAGVVNLWVTNARPRAHGLHYAPDPSSQPACTIGGNVAENSGGPHTLKYGVTTNHVLGVELVLPTARVVELGGAVRGRPGLRPDAASSSARRARSASSPRRRCACVRSPEAYRTLLGVFESVDDASETVTGIIGAGIVPGGARDDGPRSSSRRSRRPFTSASRLDAGAVLIIEVDGARRRPRRAGASASRRLRRDHGAREVRVARDDAERAALWKSRKRAFGAVGRLAPNYCTQDGVVPRTKRAGHPAHASGPSPTRHALRIANVFHAGDGNIHPILLFDERDPDAGGARARGRATRSSRRASRSAAASPASTASASRRWRQMPLLFAPDDLRPDARAAAPSSIRSAAQPAQDLSAEPRVCAARSPQRRAAL